MHVGDNTLRTGDTIDGSENRGVPGDRWGGFSYQMNAFIKAAETNPAGFLAEYHQLHVNGKPARIEIGYGFEQAAFGNPIATKQEYENFAAKYLKNANE